MNHIVVTGGAGFLSSHLCRALLSRGDRVTTVDNFSTGRAANIADSTGYPRFTLCTTDTTAFGAFTGLDGVTLEISEFACTAIALAGTGRLEYTPSAAKTDTAAANLTHTHNSLGRQPIADLPTGLLSTLDWIRTIITGAQLPRPH